MIWETLLMIAMIIGIIVGLYMMIHNAYKGSAFDQLGRGAHREDKDDR